MMAKKALIMRIYMFVFNEGLSRLAFLERDDAPRAICMAWPRCLQVVSRMIHSTSTFVQIAPEIAYVQQMEMLMFHFL